MAILIDENKRVLVQGITGREGRARTRLMREYGTNVVAGVTPGKGWSDCSWCSCVQHATRSRELVRRHRHLSPFCASGGSEGCGDFCD